MPSASGKIGAEAAPGRRENCKEECEMLNENVTKVLSENLWSIATVCEKGWPNVVPVAFRAVLPDGTLAVGDVFLDRTLKNLTASEGRIAVSAFDAATHEGYQIKGHAVYVTEGEVVADFKAAVEKLFGGKMTAKGAVLITPEKVIVTTPGPDNKKEL